MKSSPPPTRRPGRRAGAAVIALAAGIIGCGTAEVGGADTRPARPAPDRVATAAAQPTAASQPTAAATPTDGAPAVAEQVTRLPPKPAVVASPIPFGPRRKAEMVAYAGRHYRLHTYRLVHPQVIVVHYTDTSDFSSTFNTFAPDVPDSELHELPGTCAHFVVDKDGTIHQLVSVSIMCRHTVGLNWTAIGIENVGFSDGEILGRPRQLRASLALTNWLRCRFQIHVRNVIGHSESLSSPFHHENVAALRTQTHGDWTRGDMQVYRARLRALGGCPS